MGEPKRKNEEFVPPNLSENFVKTNLMDKHFNAISKIIYDHVGIHLNENKKIMVESRLSKRLKHYKIDCFEEYLKILDNSDEESQEFINALTTNKTEFFREVDHFTYLRETVLHELVNKSRDNRIKVWSAACSTGEEVYSLYIELNEFLNNYPEFDLKILGTDIDTHVLDRSKNGIYGLQDVSPIRMDLIAKYFQKGLKENAGLYMFRKEFKENIKFRKFNLVNDEIPFEIKFDVIFLRNVLIYFQADTVQKVINKLERYLNKGGYLFIGHSETLNQINHNLKQVKAAVYKKV